MFTQLSRGLFTGEHDAPKDAKIEITWFVPRPHADCIFPGRPDATPRGYFVSNEVLVETKELSKAFLKYL
jgi:hypothetical protein